MTSLAMNELSQAEPLISFIHTYPGVVKTNLTRDMGVVALAGAKMLLNLATPSIVPLQESGERHLYLVTNRKFGRRPIKVFTSTQPETTDAAMEAYLVDHRGTPRQNLKLLRRYSEEGVARDVWEHTLDVFRNVCGDAI
ncbi:Oxidoreductase andH [Talaromyces pinophilus]|nr:Oxidoreductase andH [Talaromyces pinophilus]